MQHFREQYQYFQAKPSADCQGDRDLPQVHRHRPAEHRLLSGGEVCVPCADRSRLCQYVGGDLRGCRRDDYRGSERDPRAQV